MGGRPSSPLDKRQQQHLRGEPAWGTVGVGVVVVRAKVVRHTVGCPTNVNCRYGMNIFVLYKYVPNFAREHTYAKE